jgi:hypothetical protein
LSYACYMACPSHHPWLDHWNSSLCGFLQPPVTSSLFSPNILLSTLFSNAPSLCFSLNIRDQVSHPYKTTEKVIVLNLQSSVSLHGMVFK